MYMIWWIFLKIYLSIIDIWYISFDCFKWFKSIEFVHIHSSSIFVSSQTWVILLVLHPLSLAPTQWAFTLVCLREKWFSSYLFSVFVLIFINSKTCIFSNIVKCVFCQILSNIAIKYLLILPQRPSCSHMKWRTLGEVYKLDFQRDYMTNIMMWSF